MSSLREGILRGLVVVAALGLAPVRGAAQDAIPDPPPQDTTATDSTKFGQQESVEFANTTAGEFTPGRGWQIFRSKRGSLNISVYGLFRWLNQMPGDQVYTDNLGRERVVPARNDLYWQRSMVWFTGFFWDPRFAYNLTVWSLGATQQTLVFGNLQYRVGKALTVGVGMAPNLTVRSMQGSWPFWAGSDRQMSEEYFRAGFASGAFITGQPVSRLWYTASVNTNLSQLGVTASNDARSFAWSTSAMWMPTTGEFGPRGGFGDLEYHKHVATRFGTSFAYAPSEYRAAPPDQKNNETQLRFSDGVYAFEAGALAEGVTIEFLAYTEWAVDAGLKYRGLSLQAEYYQRNMSNFRADGPLPVDHVFDRGVQAQIGYMVVPRYVLLYVSGGYLWDQYQRHPYEFSPGFSVYPTRTRSWRLNLHTIRVYKSPTGSTFGYYAPGQTGWTVSLGTDILF
jgi:hypothetical protein